MLYETYFNLSVAFIAASLFIFIAIIIYMLCSNLPQKIKILNGKKQEEEYYEFASIIERENELQSKRRIIGNKIIANKREHVDIDVIADSGQNSQNARKYVPTTELD